MKRHRIVWAAFIVIIGLMLVGMFVGTPRARSPEEAARRDLGQRGAEFTPDAFVGCAAQGDFDMVALYVAAGINVNGVTDAGNTALCAAAAGGHLAIVEHLLDHGSDIDQENGEGKTPIVLAGLNGQVPVMIYLSQRGAKKLPMPDTKANGASKLEPIAPP